MGFRNNRSLLNRLTAAELFIAPLPFQNTPVVETMQYGALLGGKRLRPFPGLRHWSYVRR